MERAPDGRRLRRRLRYLALEAHVARGTRAPLRATWSLCDADHELWLREHAQDFAFASLHGLHQTVPIPVACPWQALRQFAADPPIEESP